MKSIERVLAFYVFGHGEREECSRDMGRVPGFATGRSTPPYRQNRVIRSIKSSLGYKQGTPSGATSRSDLQADPAAFPIML